METYLTAFLKEENKVPGLVVILMWYLALSDSLVLRFELTLGVFPVDIQS